MLQARVRHGCGKITMKTKNYFVVFGGEFNPTTPLSSIHLYDIESAQWTIAPVTMFMPQPVSVILSSKINQMNENACDLMFISSTGLYICRGNYEWTSFNITHIDGSRQVAIVGANDVVPCGI